MEKRNRIFFIFTITLIFMLSGCEAVAELFHGPNPEKENDVNNGTQTSSKTFTNISDFASWLTSQPRNDAATAYKIKLNVSDLGGNYDTAGSAGKVLRNNPTKYVSIDFSDSTITGIDSRAFYLSSNLISVTIGNSVTSIENDAFGSSSITSVIIGNSVTDIGYHAFGDCKSLISVTIGNSVTSIDSSVFYLCTSLTSITIPDSVTSIGYFAFAACTSLTSVTFQGTITSTNFETRAFGDSYNNSGYIGDLRAKYLAATGGIGTYTRPNKTSYTWTKN